MSNCWKCHHDKNWHGEEGGQPPRRRGDSETACYWNFGAAGACHCSEYMEPMDAPPAKTRTEDDDG
jgi:hypothetical protein